MELPLFALFEVKYSSLFSRHQREVKENILIVIIGTLILCGWSLLGVIFVNNSNKLLGVLDPSIVTTVIFLVMIPYSISIILDR